MVGVARSFFFSRSSGFVAEAWPLAARGPIAPATAITPRTVRLLAGAQHDGRGAFLQRVDPHREVAEDVFVDRHRALEFLDRRRWCVDVEQGVVALAVLLYAVGQRA